MKFYQVHRTCEAGTSAGYEYHGSKREADKAANAWIRNGSETDEHGANVTVIDVAPTRAGILAALNRYAEHADNG